MGQREMAEPQRPWGQGCWHLESGMGQGAAFVNWEDGVTNNEIIGQLKEDLEEIFYYQFNFLETKLVGK